MQLYRYLGVVLVGIMVLSGCGRAALPENRPAETAQLTNAVWRLESLEADLSTRVFQSTAYTAQQMLEFRERGIDPAETMDPPEIGRRVVAYSYNEPIYQENRSYTDYGNIASSTSETTSTRQYMEVQFLANGGFEGRTYDGTGTICAYRPTSASRWGWKDSTLPLIEFSNSLFSFDSAARIRNYTVTFDNGRLILSAHTGDEPGLTGGYNEAVVRAVFRPVTNWRCASGQQVETSSSAAPAAIGAGTTTRAPGDTEPVYREPARPILEQDAEPRASFTMQWDKQTGVLRLDGSASTAGYSYQWFLGWLPAGSETLVASTDPRLVMMVYESQLQSGRSASVRWVVLNLLDPEGRVVASERQILQ